MRVSVYSLAFETTPEGAAPLLLGPNDIFEYDVMNFQITICEIGMYTEVTF